MKNLATLFSDGSVGHQWPTNMYDCVRSERGGGGNKRVVVGVSVSYVHTLCVSSSSVFCDNIISAGRHLFGPFRHANQRKTKARSGNEISGKSTLGMDDSSHKFYDLRHFIHNITVMFP
jgi:hypothetical protein